MNENRPKQRKTRQIHSPQFKDQALERAARDGVPQAAKDLGVTEGLLYSWRAKRNQGGDSIENQKIQQAEMARLKRENARLQEENSFLKKWPRTSRKNRSEALIASESSFHPETDIPSGQGDCIGGIYVSTHQKIKNGKKNHGAWLDI